MNYNYLVNKKEVSAFNESLRGSVKSSFFLSWEHRLDNSLEILESNGQ